MASRLEITKKYAREYAVASKAGKVRLLDELVHAMPWMRDHARRAIVAQNAPLRIAGTDFDNGGEFLNWSVIA